MKQSIQHDGPYRYLRISGKPDEVAARVNHLFNFSAIPPKGIPDTFKPGEDGRVVLTTYKANLEKGFTAMAIYEMRRAPRRAALAALGSVKLIRSAIRAKAVSLMAEIPRFREQKERAVNCIPTGRATYVKDDSDDADEEIIITPAQRAKEKEILAHWFGDKRARQ